VPIGLQEAVSKVPTYSGTDGSNPAPSTGESDANRDAGEGRRLRRYDE